MAGDGGQKKRVARSNLPAAPTVRSITAAWGGIASEVGIEISVDERFPLRVRSEVKRLRVGISRRKKVGQTCKL